MPSWDPGVYERFAAERARPFTDLLARVDPAPADTGAADAPAGRWAPRTVVDLGCGPGTLTAQLARRWPGARVVGVDSSPAMLERAAAVRASLAGSDPGAAQRLSFEHGDVAGWAPPGPVDLVVTNAVLQWVPGHLDLLAPWTDHLAPGGVLALQVPADFTAPLHVLLHSLAASPAWAPRVGTLRDALASHPAAAYADALSRAGCVVDAWETTYHHLLDPAGELGDDAVLAWISGSGLRPVTDALAGDPAARDAFVAEYAALLRAAYPRAPWGTALPFHRVFAVARRPA